MTPSMNEALTWWMQKYQPELLEMTGRQYRELFHNLVSTDAYLAAKELEGKGWKPNQDLVFALAGVSRKRIVWEDLSDSQGAK
jgi:hypothetical protein